VEGLSLPDSAAAWVGVPGWTDGAAQDLGGE
jgi:hypothetical protein